MSLRAVSPTFGGNSSQLRLGGRTFGLPPGARVHVVKRGRLAYVALYGSEIHALTPAGEIPIPAPLSGLVRARYFPSEPPS